MGWAALAYFALVFGAGFLLGVIRVPLLVPRMGVRTAELLEMPVMFVVILVAARFVVRRRAEPIARPVHLRQGSGVWRRLPGDARGVRRDAAHPVTSGPVERQQPDTRH